MVSAFLKAAGIGFTAGVLPGPLQTYLLVQTLRHSARYSVWLVLSPLLSDAPIIVIVLLLLGQASNTLLRVISFAGGCFVLYIAWITWQQIRHGDVHPETVAETNPLSPSIATGLRHTVAINTLSPGPWLFWGTVTGPLLIAAWRTAPTRGIAFLTGFYGMFLGILLLQVLLFQRARQMGPRIVNVLLHASLAILLVFGAILWFQALK